jgi:deoxyribonuclease IV
LPKTIPHPLGAHLSISGGAHKALAAAAELGCGALQIFVQSPGMWRLPPIEKKALAKYHAAHDEMDRIPVIAHAIYLINLASPDKTLREKSIDALVAELERCELLRIENLIFHPGAHVGSGEKRGIRKISGALNRIHRETKQLKAKTVLEITAGQGSSIGHTVDQLATIIDQVKVKERMGICIDTAHAYAAGYDLRSAAGYKAFWDEVDQRIGLEMVVAFHLNDTKKLLGSRVDRHTHIGEGELGVKAFRRLMRDRRFAKIPKVLETPKEGGMDERNLAVLREMLG